MPEKWQSNGMDLKLSYDQWIALLKQIGCTIKEAKPPTVEEFDEHDSFSAWLSALYSVGGMKYRIEVKFNYSKGTTRSDLNTLHMFMVYAQG